MGFGNVLISEKAKCVGLSPKNGMTTEKCLQLAVEKPADRKRCVKLLPRTALKDATVIGYNPLMKFSHLMVSYQLLLQAIFVSCSLFDKGSSES